MQTVWWDGAPQLKLGETERDGDGDGEQETGNRKQAETGAGP